MGAENGGATPHQHHETERFDLINTPHSDSFSPKVATLTSSSRSNTSPRRRTSRFTPSDFDFSEINVFPSLRTAITELLRDSTPSSTASLLREVRSLAPDSLSSKAPLRSRLISDAGSVAATLPPSTNVKDPTWRSQTFESLELPPLRAPAFDHETAEELRSICSQHGVSPAGAVGPSSTLADGGDSTGRAPHLMSSSVRMVSALSDFVNVDRVTAAAINLQHSTDSNSEAGESLEGVSDRLEEPFEVAEEEGSVGRASPSVLPTLRHAEDSASAGGDESDSRPRLLEDSFLRRSSAIAARSAWKRFATCIRKLGLLEGASCSYLQRFPIVHGMRRQSILRQLTGTTAEGSYVKWTPSVVLALSSCVEPEVIEAMQIIASALALRDKFHNSKFEKDVDSPAVHPSPFKKGEGSTEPIFNPFGVTPPGPFAAEFAVEAGVYHVLDSRTNQVLTNVPTVSSFLECLKEVMSAVQHPACKTFTFRRLQHLQQHFTRHLMFNSRAELEETQENKHRDFYNVRKVDTHVHHSACMHQKHLLRYIRKKYRKEANEVVARTSDGEPVTLEEIFLKEVGVTAWDASTDLLNVHALGSCFHRFDIFNSKYNPFGQPLLREVFLKTDNIMGGRYLAEMTKEVIEDLEEAKYQFVEWRLSIYGRRRDEWEKLARWIKRHDLCSKQVRYVIQVPRLFHVYRSLNLIANFQELLSNVFEPLFEAVREPQAHPDIYHFLLQLNGWDSVDDESIVSKYTSEGGALPPPSEWSEPTNPPYSYWAYYMYANIASLNGFLAARGMRVLPFRPHCGETGSISHLASMFLLADGINHGIMLKKSPVLEYLYYLSQIGLAISPLSNNALFHGIDKNPFWRFFCIGLNVSLSTDDPLMFHFTTEPLLEEYSCCAHQWKLSPVDLCEIARNSVLQSHFEPQYKRHWLGDKYTESGSAGNCIMRSNVSNIRMEFRKDTLLEELRYIRDVLQINELLIALTTSSS